MRADPPAVGNSPARGLAAQPAGPPLAALRDGLCAAAGAPGPPNGGGASVSGRPARSRAHAPGPKARLAPGGRRVASGFGLRPALVGPKRLWAYLILFALRAGCSAGIRRGGTKNGSGGAWAPLGLPELPFALRAALAGPGPGFSACPGREAALDLPGTARGTPWPLGGAIAAFRPPGVDLRDAKRPGRGLRRVLGGPGLAWPGGLRPGSGGTKDGFWRDLGRVWESRSLLGLPEGAGGGFHRVCLGLGAGVPETVLFAWVWPGGAGEGLSAGWSWCYRGELPKIGMCNTHRDIGMCHKIQKTHENCPFLPPLP